MSPPQILTTVMKNTVVDKNKDHAVVFYYSVDVV